MSQRTEGLSRALGQHNGLTVALATAKTGVLHELLSVVDKNRKATREPAFRDLVKKLSKTARTHWQLLENVADGNTAGGGEKGYMKALQFIRNKVGFCCDPKALASGFDQRSCLDPDSGPGRFPLISRGDSFQATRFYFADAAAEGYLLLQADEREGVGTRSSTPLINSAG